MGIADNEMETANNRGNEAGLDLKQNPLRTFDKERQGQSQPGVATMPVDASPKEYADAEWVTLCKAAKRSSDEHIGPIRNQWTNSLRAYRNQHHVGAVFEDPRWRGRTRLHRPKTHAAVQKGNASMAAALFSTSEIAQCSATNPLDERSLASASFWKETINYRLSDEAGNAGLPAFDIFIGGAHDAQVMGLVCSKQYWDREEETVTVPAMAPGPSDPMTGEPGPDQPIMSMLDPTQPAMEQKKKATIDRPMVRLFPMEHVIRDPAADWIDQAQRSSFLGLMYPMRLGDVETMIKGHSKSAVPWRADVDRAKLLRGATRDPIESQGVTTAREGATANRTERSLGSTARDFDLVWIIEWFIRRDGTDWCFWTAYTDTLLSDPVPIKTVYPHLSGARPVVIGRGKIEPHKTDPISKVQALLPLQQEINELVNARLDGVKESIRPLVLVRRGAQIDAKQIQNRSGDSIALVNDVEKDVKFDRPGDVSQSAYLEMANLNADYDDLAGEFNAATVQNSRQMNDTVGGMRLMSGQANVVSDFNVVTYVKSFVNPVLHQILKLEQYYEDDEAVMMMAGEKAKLVQRYGINEIDDDLLNRDISIRVAASIGSADPSVKLQKFISALMASMQALGPDLAMRANQDMVIDEIMGIAGYANAADRFFHPGDQMDPRISQMKEALVSAKKQIDDKQAERDNKVALARITSTTALITTLIGHVATAQQAQQANDMAMQGKALDHVHDLHKTSLGSQLSANEIAAQPPGPMAAAAPGPGPGPSAPGASGGGSHLEQLLVQLLTSAAPSLMPGAPMATVQGTQPLPGQGSDPMAEAGMGGDPSHQDPSQPGPPGPPGPPGQGQGMMGGMMGMMGQAPGPGQAGGPTMGN